MPILIPIVREQDGAAWLEQQVVLEGVTYTLEMMWNDRGQSWYLHVWDAEFVTPLEVGMKMVADYPMGRWSVDRLPMGCFVLIDTGAPTGAGEDPGFDDLGNRHQLHYFALSELAPP